MILLAALVAPIPAAPDAVAPPLGTPVRQVNEQVRDDGKRRRSFRVERMLRFAAEPDGFQLTITQTAATADTDEDERSRYRAANASLIGRPIVMHLDRTGALRAIDDLDAVWRDWTAGLTAAAPEGRDPRSDALRAQLDAIGASQRRGLIGSMAETLFAPPGERAPAPPRPASVTSPPPFAGLALSGTTTAVAEDGGIRVRTAASGRSPGTATTRAASVAISSDRLVDAASGLIRSWVRRETLGSPGGTLTTTTTTTLAW